MSQRVVRLDSVDGVRQYVSDMIAQLNKQIRGWRPELLDSGNPVSQHQSYVNSQIAAYQSLLDALKKGEGQIESG